MTRMSMTTSITTKWYFWQSIKRHTFLKSQAQVNLNDDDDGEDDKDNRLQTPDFAWKFYGLFEQII